MRLPRWIEALSARARDAKQGDVRAMLLLISDVAAVGVIAVFIVAIVLRVVQ